MRRLALFMDGTWNSPDSRTNVHELCTRTLDRGADGTIQLKKYVAGVGTKWYEKVRGGAFGVGLSRNVLKGYRWLVDNYQEGDEIFVFGFSRGAYTARSVVGFMCRCGLLRSVDGPITPERLFERYKAGKKHPTIRGYRELQRHLNGAKTADFSQMDLDLLESARRVPVQFVGVWDTVGALGIPTGKVWLPWNRSKYYFHDLDLSAMVKSAAHAVAIDEHRKSYSPSLWTYYTRDGSETRPRSGVEQRWFAGAHANVGGGYDGNLLCTIPLGWIQERAAALGLAFAETAAPTGREHLEPLVDAYSDFLRGVYSKIKLRHFRVIHWPAQKVKDGTSRTCNETIDVSVFNRWRDTSEAEDSNVYRPKNLIDWAEARGIEVADIEHHISAESPELMR